jgi:hypothetical protein
MVLVARSVLSLVGAIELARLPMLRYAWPCANTTHTGLTHHDSASGALPELAPVPRPSALRAPATVVGACVG